MNIPDLSILEDSKLEAEFLFRGFEKTKLVLKKHSNRRSTAN